MRICETWLNSGIPDSELLLNHYTINRSDREHRNINLKGRSLSAVKISLCSENIKVDVECCTTKNQIDRRRDIHLLFLQSTAERPVQVYDVDCYHHILEAILKNRKAVICGDLNFPSMNWGAY